MAGHLLINGVLFICVASALYPTDSSSDRRKDYFSRRTVPVAVRFTTRVAIGMTGVTTLRTLLPDTITPTPFSSTLSKTSAAVVEMDRDILMSNLSILILTCTLISTRPLIHRTRGKG